MHPDLDFASQLARKVGRLLLQHYQIGGIRAGLKNDRSVVTEADLAADRLIADAIRSRFPEDLIVSEELQTSLSNTTEKIWVVDPLDGTTNFSLGLHLWGISIARIVAGYPASAVLYFPVIDELYTARRDAGAYLNGNPIHVRPPDRDQTAAFFSCCTRTHRLYQINIPYKTRILGSAALSFCMVARGSAILAFEATPKIWDLAAGWLLACEAGGVVETLDGSAPFPLAPRVEYSQSNYPTLAAATKDLALWARGQIRPRT